MEFGYPIRETDMKYFKVLRNNNKKLVSAATSIYRRPNERQGIQYKWNKWNKPLRSSNPFLFIFTELKAAENFAGLKNLRSGSGGYAIYEVKAKGVVAKKRTRSGKMIDSYHADFPSFTTFCDSLRIVKRVR